MPSPAANALTSRHRSELAAVGRAVVRPVRATARAAVVSDVDGWFEQTLERLLAVVRAGWQVSAGSADRYLRQHAAAEGRIVAPVRGVWTPARVVTSLRVTGPVAFKRSVALYGSPERARLTMADTLAAAAARQALAGDRDTVMRTVENSDAIVGWRRVTDGDPCAFCALLASRGAVYSKATADFHAHDGDGCTPEPLYAQEDEPASVLALQEQWRQATAGTSGKAAIRAWRRSWDARREDAPQPAG